MDKRQQPQISGTKTNILPPKSFTMKPIIIDDDDDDDDVINLISDDEIEANQEDQENEENHDNDEEKQNINSSRPSDTIPQRPQSFIPSTSNHKKRHHGYSKHDEPKRKRRKLNSKRAYDVSSDDSSNGSTSTNTSKQNKIPFLFRKANNNNNRNHDEQHQDRMDNTDKANKRKKKHNKHNKRNKHKKQKKNRFDNKDNQCNNNNNNNSNTKDTNMNNTNNSNDNNDNKDNQNRMDYNNMNNNNNNNKSIIPWGIGQKIYKIQENGTKMTASIRDYNTTTKETHIWYEESMFIGYIDLHEPNEWCLAMPIDFTFIPSITYTPPKWKMKEIISIQCNTSSNDDFYIGFIDSFDPVSRRYHIVYGENSSEWAWCTEDCKNGKARRCKIWDSGLLNIPDLLEEYMDDKYDKIREPLQFVADIYGLSEEYTLQSMKMYTKIQYREYYDNRTVFGRILSNKQDKKEEIFDGDNEYYELFKILMSHYQKVMDDHDDGGDSDYECDSAEIGWHKTTKKTQSKSKSKRSKRKRKKDKKRQKKKRKASGSNMSKDELIEKYGFPYPVKPSDHRQCPMDLKALMVFIMECLGVTGPIYDVTPFKCKQDLCDHRKWVGKDIFVNPNYSAPQSYIIQVIKHIKYNQRWAVLLVPHGTNTKYWEAAIVPNVFLSVCLSQFAFLGYERQPPFPCVLLIFNPSKKEKNINGRHRNEHRNVKKWKETMQKEDKYKEYLKKVESNLIRLDSI